MRGALWAEVRNLVYSPSARRSVWRVMRRGVLLPVFGIRSLVVRMRIPLGALAGSPDPGDVAGAAGRGLVFGQEWPTRCSSHGE